MLTLDLVRLRQDRNLVVSGTIPADAEMWQGSELTFTGPVQVDATAGVMADGGVVVRGSWRAPLSYRCGRCLDDLAMEIERPLTLVFMASDGWETEDPDVRVIDHGTRILELAEPIREEILLEVPRYHVPPEKDDGSCATCGVATEEFKKGPEEEEIDPRWSALRALKSD